VRRPSQKTPQSSPLSSQGRAPRVLMLEPRSEATWGWCNSIIGHLKFLTTKKIFVIIVL